MSTRSPRPILKAWLTQLGSSPPAFATCPGVELRPSVFSRSSFSLASDVRNFASDQIAEEQAFAGNEPVTSDERLMGKGCLPRHDALQYLTWLLNPKKASTRARGCQIFLLQEDDKTLRAEIDCGHCGRHVRLLADSIEARIEDKLSASGAI